MSAHALLELPEEIIDHDGVLRRVEEILRDAKAADRPCELYAHTSSPIPTRTQGHHRDPVYLQNRAYGRIVNGTLMWLCGLCHDSVHDWISWTLGEARKPEPEPGWKAKREAQAAVDRYLAAMAAKVPTV